ncbi:hypothetical protein ACTFIW_009813 [Dictyostelium discoideum]
MVNIPGERKVTLRKELENHLQKDDKIILSNNKFKILTDCKTQVLIYANAFNGVLKGVHRAIIKPKKMFKTFDWEKSMDIVEKTLHEEGLEIIKLEKSGENLIVHSFNSIVNPEDKDKLIHCRHITILFLTNQEELKNQGRITNKDEISDNLKITEYPETVEEKRDDKRVAIKPKEEANNTKNTINSNNNKKKDKQTEREKSTNSTTINTKTTTTSVAEPKKNKTTENKKVIPQQ